MKEPFVKAAEALAALQRLELVGPDEAVDWASEHVASTESETLVALAMLEKPARRFDVQELLEALLQELNLQPMDDQSAGLEVARQLAQQIVDGSLEPSRGARRIWWDIAVRVPELEEQLRPFIGLASEWEDNPAYREEYEEDIRDAARHLLSGGRSGR